MKSSATVDQEIHFRRGRKRTALEKVQMKINSKLRTMGQGLDRTLPAGTVDHDTGSSERTGVMAGHDGIGDSCG